MSAPDQATQRQIAAANPVASTWLSANAGSGKTKVLTDRVARLLLGGTEPQKVLCLTYTKAAAAEMQNRLLKRLGSWAMLGDAELRAELRKLGEEGEISPERLGRARRLFAQAIETPGGLKIQTIHSFCAALLRRFPLEAGVAHGFREMDDRTAAVLRHDILEEIAGGEDRAAFDGLARYFSGDDLTKLINDISRNRHAFPADFDHSAALEVFGLPPDYTISQLLDDAFGPGDLKLLHDLAPILLASGPSDTKLGTVFAGIEELTLEALIKLESVLLFGSGPNATRPKIGSIPTKALREGPAAPYMSALSALMERVADARPHRLALAAAERTLALHRFARAFLPRMAARKAAQGWLDFDDLIERAAHLLSTPSVAQWVLFRLDGGIDHILVDEAQDTSPEQWIVIERLTDEFTAGEGARGVQRTIFVVGDRKQSIYSFQGADLRRFEAMQSHFSAKFAAVSRPLQETALLHSFRSSEAVLRLTDLTFAGPAAQGLGGAPEHIAFHKLLAGRVDLWPSVEKPEKPEDGHWEDPVDQRGASDAPLVLARAIAAEIRAMIDAGTQIPGSPAPRPVHEGDFLILVQRRSALFAEIIRACKAAKLAVAGVDRLKLGAELAVKDIRATLAFLATPEDDLALAEALKSPLFGWSEAMLYRLAQPRKGYLWEALRNSDIAPHTVEVLQDLRDHTDFLRPFDLIERLLTRHGGRQRLIARLGIEAEDGIDELISQALAFEHMEVPSLTGFLGWLDAEDIEVKRQLEGGGRAIRVMTVHGAKGLEAPIVILPDTAKRKPPQGSEIYRLNDRIGAWSTAKAEMPEALAQAQADEVARAEEERMRLLYVALTRAEKWLIVAAAGEVGSGGDSWYSLVAEGLTRAGAQESQAISPDVRDLGAIRRLSHGDWPAAGAPASAAAAQAPDIPAWATTSAPRPERAARALSPSDLGGAKALPGDAALPEEEAKRYGRQLHSLLEHLPGWPEDRWSEIAHSLLSTGEDAADYAEIDTILAAARHVLQLPEMAPFLAPEALAEVELTASLPELDGQQIHGIVDRLVITAECVRVLDYKSNAVVPDRPDDVPLGILRQMAAYRAALRQIYPAHPIECLILWTRSGQLMPLPPAQLDAALRTATAS
ncbi:double-strand break repair helicase AddA [Sedimentimonas flavescens]|uniref:DNA 3'-5' helicase n=1 Tax=Sedimentimonas flavescens TaxID=2851012 RepID=A0ABT2ZYS2_9RHOB|nr:double-strand break repair helicase AddA [Sedimentimonas flavescens]MCV2878892.1 double-strand break repair helicase AddA [Sedimentimonas flavescens]